MKKIFVTLLALQGLSLSAADNHAGCTLKRSLYNARQVNLTCLAFTGNCSQSFDMTNAQMKEFQEEAERTGKSVCQLNIFERLVQQREKARTHAQRTPGTPLQPTSIASAEQTPAAGRLLSSEEVKALYAPFQQAWQNRHAAQAAEDAAWKQQQAEEAYAAHKRQQRWRHGSGSEDTRSRTDHANAAVANNGDSEIQSDSADVSSFVSLTPSEIADARAKAPKK